MLNIPDIIKELFDRDGVRKNFRACFPGGELPDITNKDVVRESVRFTESICSQDVLKFGLTEASVLEFETVGVANMYGMMVEAYCEIDVSSLSAAELDDIRAGSWDGELVERAASDIGWPFFRIPYGVFRVESCPRNQEAMAHRKVTAYSLSYARMSKALADLPANLPFDSLVIDPAAFFAQVTGEQLLEVPLVRRESNIVANYLYDASGYYYSFHVANEEGTTLHTMPHWPINWPDTAERADFVKVNMDANGAYSAAAEAVLAEFERLGISFCYDHKKKKVFSNNEVALRTIAPVFFFPVIETRGFKPSTSQTIPELTYYQPLLFQRVENDRLIPIIRDAYSLPDSPAFAPGSNKNFVHLRSYFTYLPPEAQKIRVYTDNPALTNLMIDLPPMPAISEPVVNAYRLAGQASYKIRVENAGTSPTPLMMEIQTTGDGYVKTLLPLYSYIDAYDREALLDGYLELNAMFGKVDRRGKLQGLRLSVDEPVSVGPSQYSEFWWDEYDVEPIGSVLYSFEDAEEGEQELEYTFGSGASVYDMTDNAVLKSLEAPTSEMVQQLLEESFVPHLLPVAFTPIELSMQGQPYLEDGDYLAVAAADGTVARSFNMRHELSGIQVLEAEVTSVSGQIMDSDVEVYG